MAESTITESDIAAAEKLLGLSFTASERAQMLGALPGQIARMKPVRDLRLPNGAPTASRFDPRLPGFVMPAAQDRLDLDESDPGPLPEDDADIAFAPAHLLRRWLRGGAITSRRLTEIYLSRIAALNPSLKCFATVTDTLALAEAEAADALIAAGNWLGPLHGIPYGIKDLFDTAGVATEWGAEPYIGRVPERDAAAVRLLRRGGAVMLGKTTTGAIAYGDIWHGGQTRNPWNLDEGASGSSAGSAAAVAAGMCGFAIGTETLGSIVSPSHRCGATGLRPSFGRISRAGAMTLCPSLDKVGPIARAVEDCAMVLSVLNGADPADRGSIAAPFAYRSGAGLGGLRIGFLPEAFGAAAAPPDHAALEAMKALAAREGAQIVEASLRTLPYGALFGTVYAEATAVHKALSLDDLDDKLRWQDDVAWPNMMRAAWLTSAPDLVELDRLRYQVMEALDDLFADIDLLIGPASTGPMLIASNFTGHPCVHLRTGFDAVPSRARGGLSALEKADARRGDPAKTHRVPHGVSLWGRLYDEGRLLAAAASFEAALGVAEARPDLPA
ncbi:MAG: amidase [Paracoccus sp. (in: a-proteobacteria)]|nr:amidase [Paracoccus sp. (in: a-proteobacteria)]